MSYVQSTLPDVGTHGSVALQKKYETFVWAIFTATIPRFENSPISAKPSSTIENCVNRVNLFKLVSCYY